MIRKAKITDAELIHKLISSWAKKRRVLDRPLNYVYEHIRDFWVYTENKKIIGACALHIVGWQGLAEVKSLAVARGNLNKKIGTKLVKRCLKETKDLSVSKVFALTFVPGFFEKCGFKKIKKEDLPHKIWSECVQCVYFPNCKETAVIKEVSSK